MDERAERLKEHLEYLRRELERLHRERDKIDLEISLVQNGLKNHQALFNSWAGESPSGDGASPGKYNGMSQVAAARRFLAEHDNKPFHASVIWSELSAREITSKAKHPVWALATNLKLHKDFEAVGHKKATFRLTDEAYQAELERIKREAMKAGLPK
jgi:hypothetical protein